MYRDYLRFRCLFYPIVIRSYQGEGKPRPYIFIHFYAWKIADLHGMAADLKMHRWLSWQVELVETLPKPTRHFHAWWCIKTHDDFAAESINPGVLECALMDGPDIGCIPSFSPAQSPF